MLFFHSPGDPALLTPGEAEPAIEAAMGAWNATCLERRFVDGGEHQSFDPQDGVNGITWDDPSGDIDAGVVAVTYQWGHFGPVLGSVVVETDIVLNDGIPWATEAEIAAGTCVDQYSIVDVLTRHLGWAAGIESGTGGVVMDNTGVGACTAAILPDADDIAALQAIWGPSVTVVCEDVSTVPVPVSVACVAQVSEGAVDPITWTAGDHVAEGPEAVFQFDEGGVVQVRACTTFPACPGEPVCGRAEVALLDLSPVRVGGADAAAPSGCVATPHGGVFLFATVLAAALAAHRSRRPAPPPRG